MRLRVSPSMVVALIALFFAVSGSTFALAAKKKPAPAQPKCAVGAVRGIIEVTGQPDHGIANVPDAYTSDPSYFGQRWSCSGGAMQARRLDKGEFDVKFVGNAAASAVVSGMNDAPVAANVKRSADGSFHITLGTPTQPYDSAFVVVVF